MHVGLIGGIGPAVTFRYYQRLFEIAMANKFALELTVVNCDMSQFLHNFSQDPSPSLFFQFRRGRLVLLQV